MKLAELKKLPLKKDIESKKILKKSATAHGALAELKGVVSSIPNESILINTLGLQEAKDSSAIENIITTHDDIFKATLNLDGFKSPNAKEVQNYISALKKGFSLISKNKKMAKISPKRGSLASVIRSFKSVVTKFSREINPNFAWQPRFYDHIIRNEKSLNAIRQYIIQNPEMWHRDRNNEMGLKM